MLLALFGLVACWRDDSFYLANLRHFWTIIAVKNHVSRLQQVLNVHPIFIYDFTLVKYIGHNSYRIDDVPRLPRLRSQDVVILFKLSII